VSATIQATDPFVPAIKSVMIVNGRKIARC
jgi:hypothetical protein